MDYVVFRSDSGVRAVQVERGKGVPKEHQMKTDEGEYFGVVVGDAPSPEAAIWRAALEFHSNLIEGLVEVLGLYLEEIGWDRDRPLYPEHIDEVFKALKSFREEGVVCTKDLGLDLEKEWPVPVEAAAPEHNPDQLSLL